LGQAATRVAVAGTGHRGDRPEIPPGVGLHCAGGWVGWDGARRSVQRMSRAETLLGRCRRGTTTAVT
jgi:hypothetical protein